MSYPALVNPVLHSIERCSAAVEYGRIAGLLPGSDGTQVCLQGRGLYVHYLTPCLPLASPNTRTPNDDLPTPPDHKHGVKSQVLHLLTNYPAEYVPINLLCNELNEAPPPTSAASAAPVWLPSPAAHSHGFLLYPSRANLECLVLGALYPPDEDAPVLSASFAAFSLRHAPLRIKPLEMHRFPGKLRQLDAVTCRNKSIQVYVGGCSDYLAAFFEEADDGDHTHLQCCGVWSSDVPITAVKLSPYIPCEALISLQSGSLYLWNRESGVVKLRLTLNTAEFNHLCYSNHPRRMIIAEPSSLTLADYTSQEICLKPLLCRPCSVLPPHVTITCISHDPDHTHCVLVATTEQLLLVDVRQPLPPLLVASHELTHPPSSITTLTTLTGHTLVLLSSRRECVVFSCVYADGCIPHFTTLPFSADHPREFAESMSAESAAYVNEVGYRLRVDLAGACLVQLEDSCVAVVELTALGDLFYQKCSLRATPSSAPLPSVLPGYQLWVEEAWRQEQELALHTECSSQQRARLAPATHSLHTLMQYVVSPCSLLCPHCLAFSKKHSITLPPSSLTPPTSIPQPPYKCVFCRCTLQPPPTLHRTNKTRPKLRKTNILPSTGPPGNPLRGCIDVRAGNSFDEQLMRGWDDMGDSSTGETTPIFQLPDMLLQASPKKLKATPTTARSKLKHKMGF